MTKPSEQTTDWRPIADAPRKGPFMAYRPRVKGPCLVHLHGDLPGMVVEPATGKAWITEWWMPVPPLPPGVKP